MPFTCSLLTGFCSQFGSAVISEVVTSRYWRQLYAAWALGLRILIRLEAWMTGDLFSYRGWAHGDQIRVQGNLYKFTNRDEQRKCTSESFTFKANTTYSSSKCFQFESFPFKTKCVASRILIRLFLVTITVPFMQCITCRLHRVKYARAVTLLAFIPGMLSSNLRRNSF